MWQCVSAERVRSHFRAPGGAMRWQSLVCDAAISESSRSTAIQTFRAGAEGSGQQLVQNLTEYPAILPILHLNCRRHVNETRTGANSAICATTRVASDFMVFAIACASKRVSRNDSPSLDSVVTGHRAHAASSWRRQRRSRLKVTYVALHWSATSAWPRDRHHASQGHERT